MMETKSRTSLIIEEIKGNHSLQESLAELMKYNLEGNDSRYEELKDEYFKERYGNTCKLQCFLTIFAAISGYRKHLLRDTR